MSDPENKDIRQLVKTIQPELPEAGLSSILSETSIVSVLNESDILKDHKSMMPDVVHKDTQQTEENQTKETPKKVFLDAAPLLNSVLNSSMSSNDESFVVSRRHDSETSSMLLGDSFLDLNTAHSSFLNPNESSFVLPSVVPHRRSIRESQYNSLLMPDNKRISSYDSLLRTSDVGFDQINNYHSLFSGVSSHENSVLNSSTLNTSVSQPSPHRLSTLSTRLSEFNERQKNVSFDETTLSGSSTTLERTMVSGEPDPSKSHVEERSSKEMTSIISEEMDVERSHSVDSNENLNSSEEDHHSDQMDEGLDQQPSVQTDDHPSENQMSEEELLPSEHEDQHSEEDEMSEQEDQPSEEKLQQSDHSTEHSVEDQPPSNDSFMSDMPNNYSEEEELPQSLNSVEETAIKELLINSQETVLEETLMPPPKYSLKKMIIPLKNQKVGRRKGSRGKDDLCMPQNLIKKLVSSSTTRRVDKNSYDVIDDISHDFFEMICDRLDDYCHLGKRNTINVSDVVVLMKRQRLINNNASFEDLVRDNLNKQQIDALIAIPEYRTKISDAYN